MPEMQEKYACTLPFTLKPLFHDNNNGQYIRYSNETQSPNTEMCRKDRKEPLVTFLVLLRFVIVFVEGIVASVVGTFDGVVV